MMAPETDSPESGDVEFFGVKLKVRSPHLAALLNSSVNEDVQVIGRRARDAFAADVPSTEPGVVRRLSDAEGSIDHVLDDLEER